MVTKEEYIRIAQEKGIEKVIKTAKKELLDEMYNNYELETSIYEVIKEKLSNK